MMTGIDGIDKSSRTFLTSVSQDGVSHTERLVSPSQPTALHAYMRGGQRGPHTRTPYSSVDTQELLHAIFLARRFDARSYTFPRNDIGGFVVVLCSVVDQVSPPSRHCAVEG